MFEGLLAPQHLLIILAVALFVFGPKKLPEFGQGLGKGLRSFKESLRAAHDEPTPPPPPAAAQTPEAPAEKSAPLQP